MEAKMFYEKLLEVQKEIQPILKDEKNPFFDNAPYATYDKIIEVAKKACNKYGLIIVHQIDIKPGSGIIFLRTRIMDIYEVGISSEMPLINKSGTDQGMGSSITYAKRYTLQSLLGISTYEDDDGNLATHATQGHQSAPHHKPQPIPANPGDMTVNMAWKVNNENFKGKKISEFPKEDLQKIAFWCKEKGKFLELKEAIDKFLRVP